MIPGLPLRFIIFYGERESDGNLSIVESIRESTLGLV